MNATPTASSAEYEFGDFRLDAVKRTLRRRDGSVVPLSPRVFDTLCFLVEHPDTVLDKERIMEAVWPDSIVEENNLTQNISALRRTFGETPGSHRFIVTVPGRGYRFVAGVRTATSPLETTAQNTPINYPAPADASTSTKPINTVPPPAHQSRRSVLVLGIACTLIVVLLACWWAASRRPQRQGAAIFPSQSIAVLPFANLSDHKENDYFAAAVQDEILTSLAQSPELKVISRTSANAFVAGQQRNAQEIAQRLGVTYLLEGSVQRVGDHVRVHAQLIDARTDTHQWAQTYDRQVADLLAIEDEIASAIAKQLGARLTASSGGAIAARPTQNAQAYLLYLQARQLELTRSSARSDAVELYRKAIAADPTFALARARFALFLLETQVTDGNATTEARVNANEALRLQPNLGEAHLALTCYYLYLDGDPDHASAELTRAAQLLPNSAEVPLVKAFICKRQNRLRDRLAALREAETLDPLNLQVRSFLVLTFRWTRQWQQAIDAADARAVFHDHSAEFVSAWARASDEFRLTGNIEALRQAAYKDAQATGGSAPALLNFEQYQLAMFERDFLRARQFLDQIPPSAFGEQLLFVGGHLKETHEMLVAVASNADAATKAEILSRAESAIAAAQADARVDLPLVHALAGNKEQALRELEASITDSKLHDTIIEQNEKLSALAAVYARVGEADKALDLIEHLLTVPAELQRGAVYNMTLTDLKWCWIWDPLRSNPRFQKLLAGPEPKTMY